jgi:hypothetical protein
MPTGSESFDHSSEVIRRFVETHKLRGKYDSGKADTDLEASEGWRFPAMLIEDRHNEVGWWLDLYQEFQALSQAELARECLQKAEELLGRGAEVTWMDIERLGDMAREETARQRKTKVAVPLHYGLPAPESKGEKQSRLGLVLGRGDIDAVKKRLDKSYRSGDLEATVLCRTGQYRFADLRLPKGMMVDIWYTNRNSKVAIEEFLTAISQDDLKDWLPACVQPLVTCGMAFRHLGDAKTAYACFKLVSYAAEQLTAEEESDPSRQSQDRDSPAEMAAHFLKQLSWAADHLDQECDERQAEEITPLGQYLIAMGMPNRYTKYLMASENGRDLITAELDTVFQPLLLVRGWMQLNRQYGWILEKCEPRRAALAELKEKAIAEGSPRSVTERPAWKFQRNGERGKLRAKAPPLWRVVVPPPKLRKGKALQPPRFRVQLGYAVVGGRAEAAQMELGAQSPVLMAGPFVNDRLFLHLLKRIRKEGRCPIWVRHVRADSSILDLSGMAACQEINPGAAVLPEAAHWLKDFSANQEMREPVRALFRNGLKPVKDPAAEDCLEAVLEKIVVDSVWKAITSREGTAIPSAAIELVSDSTKLRVTGPRGLRRAALLIEYVTGILRTLRRALCLEWYWEAASDTNGEPALVLNLPAGDSLHSRLTGLLVLGSLFHSEETCPLPLSAPDSTEDFDVRARRRGPRQETGEDASEKLQTPPKPNDSARREENPWVARGLVTPGKRQTFCLLFDAGWGEEAGAILDWLRPGRFGQHHTIVLGAHELPVRTLKEKISRFQSFFLGRIGAYERAILEVATGCKVPEAPGAEAPRQNSSYKFTPWNTGHTLSELLILPHE